jgi:hypothetical protein
MSRGIDPLEMKKAEKVRRAEEAAAAVTRKSAPGGTPPRTKFRLLDQ